MAVIGIQIDKKNPEFTKCDFLFWMPQFTKFMNTDEGDNYFKKLYLKANERVFYSIFGSDWELAMSYVIAHYLTLIALQMQSPSGDNLQSISGGGVFQGIISSATVGGFNKTFDLDKTVYSSDDSLFWNQTKYGAAFMALYKTKAVPSIFVVTSESIPGAD